MRKKVVMAMLLASVCCMTACGKSNQGSVKLDPKNPVVLSVWTYYNGMQLQIFEEMVDDFNSTVGTEKGIIIESFSMGNVSELNDKIIASMNEEVGAEKLPDIYMAYSDTAYEADQKGLLADLSAYISKEEQDKYMDAYMEEAHLNQPDALKLFPVAKSTETLELNETAWAEFEQETGADKSKLSTWEGIVELAEQYYNWTDEKTPDVPDDGMAFFGRDAFANYMIIGSKQLGCELFRGADEEPHYVIDDKIMRKLWDCYYVPYVNGWFGAYGKFRSDDIKTGQLACLVGSTSGALYFPTEVTKDDGTTTPIEGGVYLLPNFEGTEPYAVQQGAGLVVTKSTKEKEYASAEFLKWFTEDDHNILFSIDSGYLPVKKSANDKAVLDKAMEERNENQLLREIIDVGVDITTNYTLYTSKAFEKGNAARNVADHSMPDAAAAAVQKRDQMIAQGMTREEAVQELTSDAAFEDWLAQFKEDMENAVAAE